MIKKYSEEKRQMVIDAREDGATIAQIATQPELSNNDTITACTELLQKQFSSSVMMNCHRS